MTRNEANTILDQHKSGDAAYSLLKVTRSLWATGDLSKRNGKPRMAETVLTESERTWPRPSAILVETDDSGHSNQARPWVSAYLACKQT
jgi:hypothetical protein